MNGASLLRRYLVLSFLFGVVWVGISFCVALMLGAAEDPADAKETVPSLLRFAYSLTLFPVRDLLPWKWTLSRFGGSNAMMIEVTGMFINGVFWAVLFIVGRRAITWFTR